MAQEMKTAPVGRRQKRRRPAHSPLAVAWLSLCMVAALGCLWGWLRAGDDAGGGVGTVQATAVLNRQVEAQPPEVPAPPPAHVPLTTMPIEQVRVGQKVPAHNPDRSQVETDTPEVDPPTWRLVTMRQTTRTDSGGVDVLNIQTIQPLSLIEATGARPGAMVPVPLDVQEMADVPGPAEVLSIDPCPPIQPGPGQLVLTTVNHLNNFLFDLTVKDSAGKQETISPTGWHKFFSQTRKAWVSACELKEGEKLAGHDGDLTVTTLARRPGIHRVYNMTVQGEHVYYVGELSLLAHNTCPIKVNDIREYREFANYPYDDLQGHEVLQNSWLRTAGANSEVMGLNPSLALKNADHILVTAAQREAGLLAGPEAMTSMTALENVQQNIAILRSLSNRIGVPTSIIDELESTLQTFINLNGL